MFKDSFGMSFSEWVGAYYGNDVGLEADLAKKVAADTDFPTTFSGEAIREHIGRSDVYDRTDAVVGRALVDKWEKSCGSGTRW